MSEYQTHLFYTALKHIERFAPNVAIIHAMREVVSASPIASRELDDQELTLGEKR
jgi:hypothetical protein